MSISYRIGANTLTEKERDPWLIFPTIQKFIFYPLISLNIFFRLSLGLWLKEL